MDDLVERRPCGSSWKTRGVFQGAVGAVCASTVPAASTGPGATSNASRVGPETMVVAKQTNVLGGEQRDAAQDYPESDSETSRIRVRADTTARGGGRPQAGGRNLPAPAQPAALLGVRAPRPPVRHAPGAVVRVRAALGPPRLLPVSDAPGRLRAVCASSECHGRRGNTS